MTKLETYDISWIIERIGGLEADAIAFPELFSDYKTVYLKSSLWRDTIRPRILCRDENKCVRCGGAASEVHHRAYTVSVMKGQDDSLLVSLCRNCHRDEHGYRRTSEHRECVVKDTDGDRSSNAHTQEVKDSANGRCFYCKGETETRWGTGGSTNVIPTERGDNLEVWMCYACSALITVDRNGQLRSDEDKIKLLSKKPVVRYSRPTAGTHFSFTGAFRRMNAIRQEGIMNEYQWNVANIQGLDRTDPEKFAQVKTRYEQTCGNGLDRHTKPRNHSQIPSISNSNPAITPSPRTI